MLIRYLIGKIHDFEVQGRVRSGNTKFGSISMCMEFKAPNWGEIERDV